MAKTKDNYYRGKWKNEDKWTFGPYFTKDDKHYIITGVEEPVGTKVTTTVVEVIPESVGQFTEVIDYQGNEVFEDDIIYVQEGTKHYLAKVQYDKRRGTFVGERVDNTTFDLENISFSVISKDIIKRIVTRKLYPNSLENNELILDFLDVYDKFLNSIAEAATVLKSADYDLISTEIYTTLKDIQFELASMKLLKEAIV